MPATPRTCSKCGAKLPQSDETIATTSTSRIRHTPSVDEGRFLPGTLVAGRYRIIGLLGRGGMGEVYRATGLRRALLPEHGWPDPGGIGVYCPV